MENAKENLKHLIANGTGEMTDAEKETLAGYDKYRQEFIAAMDDDLNTGSAIASVYDIVRELNLLVKGGASEKTVRAAKAIFDELTGLLGFVREANDDSAFIAEIEAKIAERTAAKKAKDYAKADAIRAELLSRGVILEDTAQGTKYKLEQK